jgi:membrane-associated HD superfamily phosphohydrolase
VLDLRNFFSRVGIWIFLAVLISVYSKSPVRSAINVFLFFSGMVGSYYLYTVMIAGFFPKSYMMIWIVMTVISPFMAFVCWYAKGKGIIAISISSIIFMFISRQAIAFGFWYFHIKYNLELLLWIATIFVLYQSPKQIIKVVITGTFLYFLTAQTNLLWGML